MTEQNVDVVGVGTHGVIGQVAPQREMADVIIEQLGKPGRQLVTRLVVHPLTLDCPVHPRKQPLRAGDSQVVMTEDMSTGIGHVYVGGYTSEMGGQAVGISSLSVTISSDEHVELQELEPIPLSSPSYLIRHPDRPLLYAISEGSPGQVSALTIADDGRLTLLNTVPSGDDGGCHLCIDPSGAFVVVAHYGSGSVAALGINDDGSLSEAADLMSFTGSGPDADRQDAPHAHQVVRDGDLILVTDLGTDQIQVLTVDERGKIHQYADPIQLPAGSGPRHLVIVDDHLVVACELSATLWVAPRTGRGWGSGVTLPCSESESTERIYPSAIVADGERIFVANRGSDTVAVFSLDPAAHILTQVAEFDTAGSWPRDLVLSDNHAWVANQTSDVISVFDRTGDLREPRLDFQVPSAAPACLVLT